VRVEQPLAGVAQCKKCGAVGTIVEMGLCCRIAAMIALGPAWDLPPPAHSRSSSLPFGRKRA
jgi:hypothetical protein